MKGQDLPVRCHRRKSGTAAGADRWRPPANRRRLKANRRPADGCWDVVSRVGEQRSPCWLRRRPQQISTCRPQEEEKSLSRAKNGPRRLLQKVEKK